MSTKNNVGGISDLYQLIVDSIKGYTEAAEKVKTPELSTFLRDLIRERTGMQADLGSMIRGMDPDVDLDQGTLKGDLHRAWITIREALSSSSDRSVLKECARGEGYLADRYMAVLDDKDVPALALPLLRKQATMVDVRRSNINTLAETISYID